MKIAIISDTHDNLATLDKFLDYAKQYPIAATIHCGDIASGETLERLVKNFSGKVFTAFGNMDYRPSVKITAKNYPQKITLFEDFGQMEFDGLKIGFCHYREIALLRCQKQKFDFIFYGHTHKPWIESVNGCQLANPGTLAGMFYQATFAILETQTKKLDLKIVSRL